MYAHEGETARHADGPLVRPLSNSWESFGMDAGWLLPGKVLGVALDLDHGTMSVCVRDQTSHGAQWIDAFSSGILPGATPLLSAGLANCFHWG